MKINKETFDKLPAELQKAFKPNPNNADEYDNGEEAVDGLKSALESEREAKKKAAQERDELRANQQAEIDKAREKAIKEARQTGNWELVEKDLREKLAKAEAEKLEAINARDLETSRAHEANIVADLGKLFVSPSAVGPMIKSRLKTEMVDGKPVTRVLDAAGNVTSSTIEDLRKEFSTNAEFKSILVATKGSGGGATRPAGGSGATPTKRKDFANLTEEAKFANANPVEYAAMLAQEQS